MTKQEKINILKSLNKGDEVTLKDGRTVIFERMKRTKWLGRMNGTLYDIPVELFSDIGNSPSEESLLLGAKEKQKKQMELDVKKRELSHIKPGSTIKLTNGDEVEFCKLNRTRFVGKESDGLLYNYQIRMFDKLIKEKVPNDREEAIIDLANKYKGHTIQTGWGPADIKSVIEDRKSILLYEFGEEPFTLNLEDFLGEMHKNDLGKHIKKINHIEFVKKTN